MLDKYNCMHAQVFIHMTNMRNTFVKRVLKTVSTFLVTDRFQLKKISTETKLDALVKVSEKGLDRVSGKSVALPIFHAFSIDTETKSKLRGTQKNLLSQQIKNKEYADQNGKLVEDVLESWDVAMMIIMIIRNYMVSML